jgi:hypothetical protein
MKYFIIFLLGAALGSLATIVCQPTFSCVLTNLPANTHNIKADSITENPVAVLPSLKKEDDAPTPIAIKEEDNTPTLNSASIEVKENFADNLPLLDYTAVNERPIFWPSAVKVLTTTTVPLLEKNKKVADLPLNTGEVLQLSKVYGDGKLEVRAKNLKFEIDSKLTNFDQLVREKIKELAAQGNNTLAPFVRPGENYIPPMKPKLTVPVAINPLNVAEKNAAPPIAEPETTEPVSETKGRSLDDKMNALFTQGASPTEKDKTKPKNNKK